MDLSKEQDPEFYKVLVLLGATGIRPCDVVNLKVKDFDLISGKISVKMSKTSREIQFPIYDDLKSFIEQEMPEIISGEKEKRIFDNFTVYIIGRRFRRVKEKLGLHHMKKYNLKTFRKSLATKLIDKGMDGLRVATLLGHTSVNTTTKYYVNKKTEMLKENLNNIGLKIIK